MQASSLFFSFVLCEDTELILEPTTAGVLVLVLLVLVLVLVLVLLMLVLVLLLLLLMMMAEE